MEVWNLEVRSEGWGIGNMATWVHFPRITQRLSAFPHNNRHVLKNMGWTRSIPLPTLRKLGRIQASCMLVFFSFIGFSWGVWSTFLARLGVFFFVLDYSEALWIFDDHLWWVGIVLVSSRIIAKSQAKFNFLRRSKRLSAHNAFIGFCSSVISDVTSDVALWGPQSPLILVGIFYWTEHFILNHPYFPVLRWLPFFVIFFTDWFRAKHTNKISVL